MSLSDISGLVARYGYLAVFVTVLLASDGVPIPAGEVLIAAAAYAAQTHRLSLGILIGVGSVAAVLGGAGGFALGRSVGVATLQRYGARIGLGAARMRLGEYLFRIHGGKIVFSLRFTALIGPFGGVLAGANRMPFGRFMVFNVLGGVVWTIVFGGGGYLFSAALKSVGKTVGVAAAVLVAAAVVGLVLYLRSREAELQKRADALLLSPTSEV